jgi:phospholipase C
VFNFDKVPSAAGIVPVNLLLQNDKYVSEVSDPYALGTVPLRLLPQKFKYDSVVPIEKNELGTEPVNWLLQNDNTARAVIEL